MVKKGVQAVLLSTAALGGLSSHVGSLFNEADDILISPS